MRAFLCLLFDLFGEPGDIAARGLLSRKNRALMLPWLHAGEAFLRRLLFIEALALSVETRAPARKRAARPRVRRLHHFCADKPDDWRVTFRLAPSARRAGGGGGRRLTRPALALPPALVMPALQPAQFQLARALCAHRSAAPRQTTQRAERDADNAWPMAERFEAMLRAYNDPEPAARRLARLLQCKPQRALQALRPAPAALANLFGIEQFARCDAIVASRRRRCERPARADSS
jgi:hypothetical protein